MPAIEKKSYCTSEFLDYQTCFVTVCRKILFDKLERYGVEDRLHLEFIEHALRLRLPIKTVYINSV